MDENEQENKLRKLIKFKWTNSVAGPTPVDSADAVFEVATYTPFVTFNVFEFSTSFVLL